MHIMLLMPILNVWASLSIFFTELANNHQQIVQVLYSEFKPNRQINAKLKYNIIYAHK